MVVCRRVVLVMALFLVCTACSDPQEEIASGANGVDGDVGGVALRGVRIIAPPSTSAASGAGKDSTTCGSLTPSRCGS